MLTPFEAFFRVQPFRQRSLSLPSWCCPLALEHTGALTYIALRLLTPIGNSEITLTIVIMVLMVAHEFALSHGLRGFSIFELGKVGTTFVIHFPAL